MLRSTVVSLIAQRLGNRTDLDAQIISELQLTQDTLERADMLPFFLLTEFVATVTVAAEERLKLPDDFLKEYEEGALWYYDATSASQWAPLKRSSMEQLKGAFTTEGYPQYYALAGNYFRLAPVPDEVYSVKMLYYAQDTVLSTDVENQWLKYCPEWILSETGARMAAYIQNDKMAATFMQNAQMAKDKFWRYDEGRKHSNQDYRMEYK
jgi:hypothetical protein